MDSLLPRLRRAARRNRLCLGLTVGAIVLAACTDDPTTVDDASALEAPTEQTVARQVGEGETRVVGTGQITEGSCVDLPDATDLLSSFTEVSCTDEHDGQVAATFDLIQVGAFPGIDEVLLEAETGCVARFEDFIGVAYADSIYFVQSFTPTEESWNELGDRGVVCVVLPPEGLDRLVGDLRGVAE